MTSLLNQGKRSDMKKALQINFPLAVIVIHLISFPLSKVLHEQIFFSFFFRVSISKYDQFDV